MFRILLIIVLGIGILIIVLQRGYEQYQAEQLKMAILAPSYHDSNSMLDYFEEIPTSLEITLLLKEDVEQQGGTYNKNLLTQIQTSNTDFHKALHLGILATDIAYANLWGKIEQSQIDYKNLQNLSQKLNIAKLAPDQPLKNLLKSSNNIDSLFHEAQMNFRKVDNKLIKEQRSELGILILTGSWLEAVHIASQIYGKTNAKMLRYFLGKQKDTLRQIVMILENYRCEDEKISQLHQELKNIEIQVFNQVRIETIPNPAWQEVQKEIKQKKGHYEGWVPQQNLTTVYMDDELITKLSQLCEEIKVNVLN